MIGQDMTGLSFLDLFSGSGAVALEAVSRGAAHVTMVEKDDKCAKVIEGNIDLFGLSPTQKQAQCDLLHMDAFVAVKFLHKQQKTFDVLYIDPPYHRGLLKKMLKTLGAYVIMKPASLVIIEHGKRETLPQESVERFSLLTHRKYGVSYLALYQYK